MMPFCVGEDVWELRQAVFPMRLRGTQGDGVVAGVDAAAAGTLSIAM
jgi:hypothetical protein